MKIPGIWIGDKVTEVQLMLLWVVNHFIMKGNATPQLEDNRNKDVIMFFFFRFTYLLNALRFKLRFGGKKFLNF